MATFTVGDGGLSFAAAISEAISNPGADLIQFDPSVTRVTLGDVVAISGEITINGDHNGDGISDVVFVAAEDKRHLTISPGADVTIQNVDFINGRDIAKTFNGIERIPATSGTFGTSATITPGEGLDGADANDDAGAGQDGEDGIDGIAAAGSILNRGTLTLQRVGFGDNFARGEIGQGGGQGGFGGRSSGLPGESDYLTEIRTLFGADPLDLENNFLPGGVGGDGGRGGDGGDGGNGGNGGDAGGAIVNEGNLTLIDTVFGGRLSSGLIEDGNSAYGGRGGKGGGGGQGGISIGGDGGNSGVDFTRSEAVPMAVNPDDDPLNVFNSTFLGWTVYFEEANEAGAGGRGGPGGDGGDGGDAGEGGAAATVFNTGTVSGNAAILGEESLGGVRTRLLAGEAGRAGSGREGGDSRGGEGGAIFDTLVTLRYGVSLGSSPLDYTLNGFEVPGWIRDAEQYLIDNFGTADLPARGTGPFPVIGQERFGDDGPRGNAGTDGQPNTSGAESIAVISEDTGTAGITSGSTLIYLHDLGQDSETGVLSFNIIRLGNALGSVDINWALTGDGANPVSAADFAAGTSLTGTVSFTPMAEDAYTEGATSGAEDVASNIKRVDLAVAGDALDELPEGYKITISRADGSAVIGTDMATGTIVDDGLESSGPITGTPSADTLTGTEGADTINALAGNDTLRGLGGDDTLNAGDGTDSINGGPGNDRITGGETAADRRDTIFGGDGNDSIDAGHGNDLVYGQDGNDVIAGGFGADELFGQNGDDVITGSAFSDLVFGGAGDDFVNGGFGFDRINGGAGADKFFHAAADGHGSDWLQDYSAAEGDVLVCGGSGATAADFVVRLAHTASAAGERSGDDEVQEAFVNFRGQTLWALVDGAGQAQINLQIGGDVFDLLA